jgi:SAM-dependent methyltransferase
MSDEAHGQGIVPAERAEKPVEYLQRDFWRKENLKFDKPHFRMEKALRIINRTAQGRELELLDIGCGPATLAGLLPPGIHYHGIDIAIQKPAPNLLEADLVKAPVRFADKKFDIILAQGFFEYIPGVQAQKFAEIAKILNPGGTFIVTYWNYAHRNKQVFHAHRNVRRLASFREDLARHFRVDKFFAASHNWQQSWPRKKIVKAVNMRVSLYFPLVSPMLAVEYFFLCSPLREPTA